MAVLRTNHFIVQALDFPLAVLNLMLQLTDVGLHLLQKLLSPLLEAGRASL